MFKPGDTVVCIDNDFTFMLQEDRKYVVEDSYLYCGINMINLEGVQGCYAYWRFDLLKTEKEPICICDLWKGCTCGRLEWERKNILAEKSN